MTLSGQLELAQRLLKRRMEREKNRMLDCEAERLQVAAPPKIIRAIVGFQLESHRKIGSV